MNIQEVIRTLNQMLVDRVVERYAIGGAVGATFYLEPVATLDVDVFVTFRAEAGSVLVNPQPVFEYLKARGARIEGEHVIIAGWPVQFLPPNSPLVEEALAQAVKQEVEAIHTHVFTAEHLAAICLQTGRAKDKARLLQFVEANALDFECFQAIVVRHDLAKAWTKFSDQFLNT